MNNTYQFTSITNTSAIRSGDGAFIPWSAAAAGGPADTGGYVASIWKADGSPVPSAYAAPAVTPQDKFSSAIVAGVTLTWSSSTSLNGLWDADDQTQHELNSEIVSILLNGVFTNGQSTRVWLDYNYGAHTFTVAQFKLFATAIGGYVDNLYNVLLGARMPSANLMITG